MRFMLPSPVGNAFEIPAFSLHSEKFPVPSPVVVILQETPTLLGEVTRPVVATRMILHGAPPLGMPDQLHLAKRR